VIFGISTATMPAWLAKKHPDVLEEFEDNTTGAILIKVLIFQRLQNILIW